MTKLIASRTASPGTMAQHEDLVKSVRWTFHALQALADRNIDRTEVEQAIAAPELSALDPPRRRVLMRRYFDKQLQRQMLLRVVIEEALAELVVVTVYKTSQIAKYLRRSSP